MSKNIYQRMVSVMEECDYLQKKKADMGVGILYDEVIAMLRALLIKNGIVTVIRQKSMSPGAPVEGTKQKVYQGEYEMDLVNAEIPDDRVTYTCVAHGMDGGDKGPGKAHTYAAKMMLVKAFNIETGIDDESRAEKIEKKKTIDEDQQSELADLIDGNQALWLNLCKAYSISHLNEILLLKFDEVKARILKYRESASK